MRPFLAALCLIWLSDNAARSAAPLGVIRGPVAHRTAASSAVKDLPLHRDDLAAIEKIRERENLNAPPVIVSQGWPLKKGEMGVRFTSKENARHALTVVFDNSGRVVKYLGNGPILSNDSFADVARLPELTVIRIDHNIPAPGSSVSHKLYDGSGFAALAKSKLEEVRIGHAFDDAGMAALATVTSLRKVDVCHSKVTDKGIATLANHPSVEEFTISSQGRPDRITDRSLTTLGSLPKLNKVAIQETFLTYEGGLKHLAASKAPLESISFKGSLVLPADVERLRKNLPKARIEVSTPAEILSAPNSRGVAKWASPEGKAYLDSGEKK